MFGYWQSPANVITLTVLLIPVFSPLQIANWTTLDVKIADGTMMVRSSWPQAAIMLS